MAYIGNTATTQAFTPAVDYFNGDGSTVAFTLSKPVASVAQVQAVIENVPQNPGSAYTVSGNTITFTSAPPSGTANVYVYYTSPITQVIAPSQGTVGSSQLQSDLDLTGSLTVDGTTLVVDDTNNRVGIGTSSPAEKLDLVGNTDTTLRVRASSDTALILNETTPNKTWKIKSSDGTLAFQYSSTAYNSGFSSKAFITTDGYLRMASGSGGIQFNGDTSSANALDDYEEGTWTPTLGGSSSNPTGVTYSEQHGKYTKIGNLVTVFLYIGWTTYTGGSGNVTVSGLPFTPVNATNGGFCTGAVQTSYITLSSGNTWLVSRSYPNATRIELQQQGTNIPWTAISYSAFSSSGTSKEILGSLTYFTA